MIAGEAILVAADEIPIESAYRAAILTGALLRRVLARRTPSAAAHLVDVVASGRVGLCHHRAAVGIERHAGGVGSHHPLSSVNEGALKPADHLPRFKLGEHRNVTEHHQSLNVVGVTVATYAVNDAIKAGPARRLAPVGGGKRGGGLKRVIALPLPAAQPVHAPHILTPADHLANETLGRFNRHAAFLPRSLGGLRHLKRLDQAEV